MNKLAHNHCYLKQRVELYLVHDIGDVTKNTYRLLSHTL